MIKVQRCREHVPDATVIYPPIIIHAEDRKAYYACLECWDREQDLDPLIRFLQDQTAKTWAKQIQRAEKRKGES